MHSKKHKNNNHKHEHDLPDLPSRNLPDMNLANMSIDELLERAYETNDDDEVMHITELALAIDPSNPEALLLRADLLEDHEERLAILKRALESVDKLIADGQELFDEADELDDDDDLDLGEDLDLDGVDLGDIDPDDLDDLGDTDDVEPDEDDFDVLFDGEDIFSLVRLAILQRLAFTYFELKDFDCALETATECLKYEDISEDNRSRELYYRILIEMKQWQRILTETMKDDVHELGWAYARLVATFMLTPKGQDRTAAARMFWEALHMSPNVPFYILGYSAEPVSDDDFEAADFGFACLYADILSFSRDLLNWFTRGTILFGMLSDRFDSEVHDFMLDALSALGGRSEYEKMSKLITTTSDDDLIIETLAAHRCLVKN